MGWLCHKVAFPLFELNVVHVNNRVDWDKEDKKDRIKYVPSRWQFPAEDVLGDLFDW